MPLYLFILIILTAVAHTTWNVLLKTSENKVLFLRSFLLTASIVFIPVLFFVSPPAPSSYKFLGASLFIHIFYNIFLIKMYNHSEISFSYPIARGSPTLILLVISPLLLGDQITLLNEIGALVLISGIFFLIFSEGNYRKINFKGLGLSLMVASTIVVYTLVDAKGARLSENAISYGLYMFAMEGSPLILPIFFYLKIKKSLLSLSPKKNIKFFLRAFSFALPTFLFSTPLQK